MVSNMNKVLISNPFLFPPSGDNEEQKELFRTRADLVKDYILFSFKNFEKAWETEVDSADTIAQEALFPAPSITSPTLSTASTELALVDFEMDLSDDLLVDLNNYDLDDFQFSPISTNFGHDFEKEPSQKGSGLSQENTKGLIETTDQAINQIDSTETSMFPVTTHNITGEKSYIAKPAPVVDSSMNSCHNQLIHGESVMWEMDPNNGDVSRFEDLLGITANDPDPPMQHELIPQVEAQIADPLQHDVQEEVKLEAVGSIRRQRRKSFQTSRNIECSPMTFEGDEPESMDLQNLMNPPKTEVKPLITLNGTENRTRDVVASTSATSVASPEPVAVKSRAGKNSSEARRKRKYEIDDPSDPSVKNAKAAKMNRDKKKKQMQELQKKVDDLVADNQNLRLQLSELSQTSTASEQRLSNEVERLTQLLQTEQMKNSANSKQKVTMLDLIQQVVSVVNPPPQVVCVTERLAATPMPDQAELNSIRSMQHLTPQSSGNTDTYLAFKSPIDQFGQ